MRSTLSCAQSRQLDPLAAGELTLEQRGPLLLHLRVCPSCRSHYASIRRTQRQLRRLSAVALPADFEAQLTRRLIEPRGSSSPRAWLAAAALLAAVAVGLSLRGWPARAPAAPSRPAPASALAIRSAPPNPRTQPMPAKAMPAGTLPARTAARSTLRPRAESAPRSDSSAPNLLLVEDLGSEAAVVETQL